MDSTRTSVITGPLPPLLAILIFGSAWADTASRRWQRYALRSCSARRLGVNKATTPHVFVMGSLPLPSDPLRLPALEEMLAHRDLVVVPPLGQGSSSNMTSYPYEEAWRIVEERFGGANFLLLLDFRSYVNVPFMVHTLLPGLPQVSLYAGCLLDETLFDVDSPSRKYLWRRRTPLFAHGMGVLISRDVARFLADYAARTVLRRADLPVDVALGMWVQPLEGVVYESVHVHFHEWPLQPSETELELPTVGDAGSQLSNDIMRLPSGSSAVVFPMTRERWRRLDPWTCSLRW